MKRWLVAFLVAGNVAGLLILCTLLSNVGHAAGDLRIQDLTYGEIDVDGDGVCTFGDDWVVEYFVDHDARVLLSALETAKVRDDGVVDLSGYLTSFSAENLVDFSAVGLGE